MPQMDVARPTGPPILAALPINGGERGDHVDRPEEPAKA